MLQHTLRFISSARRANPVDVTGDNNEPSHIHIARPSRVRRDTLRSSVEQTASELSELDPAQVTLQAA